MTHKRIAVLISGDYRGFDTCLPTMAPLLKSTDEHKVDIYFSTWSESHHVHPLDPTLAHHVVDITSEKIIDVLHDYDVKGVAIDYYDDSYWRNGINKYNAPMCNRWEAGMKMMRDSGIEYDYLMVLRPDLYFHPNTQIDWTSIKPNTLHSAWYHHAATKFNELVLTGEFEVVAKCLPTVHDWQTVPYIDDWHEFIYKHIKNSRVITDYFEPHIPVIMARPRLEDITSYDKAVALFNNWRDLFIEQQRKDFGMAKIRENWGDDLIDKLYPNERK